MREIIKDTKFVNGFKLKHTDGLVTRDYVRVFNLLNTASEKPVWELGQWCNSFNFAMASEFVCYDNSVIISDISKQIRIFRTGEIYLELDASVEYQHLRREGEGWPHILLEQQFEDMPNLSRSKSINAIMDFNIVKFRNGMTKEQQTDSHCTQFQYIFAVSNQNKSSKGFGDYLWFNFSLFDSRHEFPPAFMQADGGKEEHTGKFIYVPEMKNILPAPIKPSQDYSINYDVLPEIINAFKVAKSRGFLSTSNFEDMCIINSNIGFEVTGHFDVGVDIKKISLMAEDK